METPPAQSTAAADGDAAFVALDVIARLREETETFGTLEAPEPLDLKKPAA